MTIVKSLRTGEQEAEFRQLWSYLLEQSSTGKAKTGVVAGCAVTATTPSATGSVVIGVGLANVQPTTGGGAFPELVTAAETVDVFTANPMQFETNPRNDIVGITQDGAGTVLVGTPNAIPTDPAVPSTVVPLWRLRHLAGATTITPQAADDLRVPVSLLGAADEDFNVRGVPMAGASTAKAGKRTHWGNFSSTAASRNATTGQGTFAHGCGFTPANIHYTYTTATSCRPPRTISIDATNVTIQIVNADGSANNSQNLSFDAFFGE